MKVATLLSLSATAYGVAFDGPVPTPVTALVYEALNGWTPKPTEQPRAIPELFRRQQKSNSAVCGYLDGDSAFPVSCTAGSCIYNTSLKWFGCCNSGTANCEQVTRCINSATVSSCLNDASCYNDPHAMACTESSAPSCVNMFAKISGATMSHWVCGASATSINVAASASSQSASASASGSGSVKPSVTKASGSGDVTAIQQGAPQSTGAAGAGGLQAATGGVASSAGASKGGAVAASSMQTAQVLLGVAGGLVGVFAVLL